MKPRRTAVCTICAKNYLPFARTLMASLEGLHPEWDRYVLLVDDVGGCFDPEREPYRLVEISTLPLPEPKQFCFRYTLLELSTAVKPWWLDRLLRSDGYDRVIYLDPDIRVYRPLHEVEKALGGEAFCVLTPHLTGRLDDQAHPGELEILRAGSYNLGFVALKRHEKTTAFLEWWMEKLEFDCVVDFQGSRFVDQKWVDLVPGMFGDVAILRHEGYNVAYWNLKHRRVSREGDGFVVNGAPLVFFHFSGLDPLAPAQFSKHQNRFRLTDLGPARDLVETYCEEVIRHGLPACREWPYAFGTFADGTPVPDLARRYLRQHPELEARTQGDPFRHGHELFHEAFDGSTSKPLFSRTMHAVWETRLDLQFAFPDPQDRSRAGFARWFADGGAEDFDLPPCCVEVIRRSFGTVAPREASLRSRSRRLYEIAKRLVPEPVKRVVREALSPLEERPSWASSLARSLRFLVPRTFLRWRLRGLMVPADAELAGHSVGFFDRDAESHAGAWMGASASVRILKPRTGRLTIRGSYAPELHLRAGGSEETRLTVTLDGTSVGRIRLCDRGTFEESLEIGGPVTSRRATLELESDQVFVPARIGTSTEPRARSVRIARIELDGAVLVDFSNGVNGGGESTRARAGVNIVGYLRSELGIGESARLCAGAASAVSLPHALVDFRAGCPSRAKDERLSDRISNRNPHPINLFHVNADQMPLLWSALGREFFADRYNIGYWFWELPEFPEEWTSSFALVDEIWAPSRFTAMSISAKSPVPVVTMPLAVEFDVPVERSRSSLGLPEDRFLFLTMYDAHSFQGRKNPEATLAAFRRAFPDDERVGLVVKTMNTGVDPESWDRLRRELAESPSVFVIDRTLLRGEVYALESCCDCFVSLHRSEGFGLGLAESMFLGKPVIGTNWSGNVDFMTGRNSCPVDYEIVELDRDFGPYRQGQRWAAADVEHAASCMRRLVEDPDYARRIGEAAARTIREELSPKAVGERYRKRIAAILSQL